MSSVTFAIGAAPPARLDKAIVRDAPEEAGLTRSQVARAIREGAVSINGTPVTEAKTRTSEGDEITVMRKTRAPEHIQPQEMALDIVHEDATLVVVNKPAGLVVHPAPGSPDGTLVNGLLAHFGKGLSGVGGAARPGIVHRIDKDTSGLLVVAKTDAAHAHLAAQFAAHTARRRYVALVHGHPDPADPRLRGIRGAAWEPGNILRIITGLARHRTDRQRQAVTFDGGRHAVTRMRVLEPFGQPPVASLVECWLETGRTHQIRVHLAHAGHGLIGDPVYGGRRKLQTRAVGAGASEAAAAFDRQALHAASLGFEHPESGEQMDFEAEMPKDMQQLMTTLRGG